MIAQTLNFLFLFKAKNQKLVNNIDALTDLRNHSIIKESPDNENPKKRVNIVEKILHFNNKQKVKGLSLDLAHIAKISDHWHLKILTPQQMLQRLPIALAQVKAGKTSKNLLNKIRQIIYSFYHKKKKLLKKYII